MAVVAPPPGGYKIGGWYWDAQAGDARQWDGSQFGAPGAVIVNPDGSSKLNSNTPSSSVASNPALDAVNKLVSNSFQTLQDQVVQKFGDYTAGNPFKVDQVLAEKTQQAKEQVDPYYDQMLGDYLQGVTNKISRGNADTKDLLSELSASAGSYKQTSQTQLTEALDKADQGFADNGLYGSGDQIRSGGQMTQGVNQDLADYMRKNAANVKNVTQTNDRNITDLNLGANQYSTQNAADKFTAENTLAGSLTKEAGQQYIRGFNATLPPQLQASNGFDMLKSLGIYS
jgi:hypothetical protein